MNVKQQSSKQASRSRPVNMVMTSVGTAASSKLSADKCSVRRVFASLLALCLLVMLLLSYTAIRRRDWPSPLERDTSDHHRDKQAFVDQYVRQINITDSPSNKWIIVDVTAPHCQRQNRFQAPKGWKVLLGRGQRQLKNWTVLYDLSIDSTGSHSDADFRENTMSKYEAYLTAIRSGARLLLDTDCSMSMDHVLDVLHVPSTSQYGLVYNDTRLFNPYAHFGAWAGVPRAVGGRHYVNNSRTYYVRDVYRVPVKHVLSDESHDMLTVQGSGKRSTDDAGVTFDSSAPPVFLGRRSFAPAVAGCSLYQQQALWGLVLPCVSPTPACHVLRQLVLQRLLWELDAFSAYYQLPTSVARSNLSADTLASQSAPASTSVSKSQSVPASQPVPSLDVWKLTSLLNAWLCATNLTFYGCFRSLADLLYSEGFIQQQDHQLVHSWITALHSSGLAEPRRVAHPCRGGRRIGEVKVILGSLRQRVESHGVDGVRDVWRQSVQPVMERCSSTDAGWLPSPAHWTSPVFSDIVLIIVYNWNQHVWPNIAFLETAHRPFFKHIVYCVSDVDQLSRAREYKAWNHVTLVEGLSDSWLLMYGCVTSVMQMKVASVQGYLMIGDDTLLNTWNFFNLPRDDILQLQRTGRPDLNASRVKARWWWWRQKAGRCAVLKALAGLEKISGMTSQQLLALTPALNHSAQTLTFSQIVDRQRTMLTCQPLPGSEVWPNPSPETARQFLYNYYHVHNMTGRIATSAHDFLYVPQAVAEDYISISRYFMKHRAMIEVAFNAIQYGLADRGRLKIVNGGSLWEKARDNPGAFFNQSHFFLHPFKLRTSEKKSSKANSEFYCGVYLKKLFSTL